MGETAQRDAALVARAQQLIDIEEPRYQQRTARSFASVRHASALNNVIAQQFHIFNLLLKNRIACNRLFHLIGTRAG